MFLNKSIIFMLYIGSVLLLCGCGHNPGVSLEEALLAEDGDTVFSPARICESQVETGSVEASEAYVYVCGAVEEPGVYLLPADSRIVAAIEAAGGFTQEACREAINLAEPIVDGMQIMVPCESEQDGSKVQSNPGADGRVNLNTATRVELMTLYGIGEARAEAILAYREELGGFSRTEQLKDIDGIGDSLFNRIQKDIYID